jgi:hypothetical protein
VLAVNQKGTVMGRKNRLETSSRTYKSGNDSRRRKYQRQVLQTREGVKGASYLLITGK